MHRHPHILNAASNLLGICFVIITGLKITNSNARSVADEIAWAAALSLLISCFLSYVSIRNGLAKGITNTIAEITFFLGMIGLFFAVVMAAAVL